MKRDGFTIVELLAVIVIMAIIIAVGTTSFRIITDRVQETALENKKSYLEIQATKYAEETGFLATNIDNLVKLGYVKADNENGKVINPITGEEMNCQIVRMTFDGHYFYALYTNEEQCDNEYAKSNVYLKLERYETLLEDGTYEEIDKLESDDAWTNKNVVLVANFTDINTDESQVAKVIWHSNAETIEKEVDEINTFRNQNFLVVKAEQIIDTIYSVEVIMKDGTTYEAQVPIKIDKQGPVVFSDELKVKVADIYSGANNEVRVVASDGNGKGIDSYYVGTNNKCNEISTLDYLPNNNTVYTTTVARGIYYVCVKDKLGNFSEEESTKVIDLVNLEPPELTVKENPLLLGSTDLSDTYEFRDNIDANFGIFEEVQISCNPTNSLNLSTSTVTCTALSTNGLASTISFEVQY